MVGEALSQVDLDLPTPLVSFQFGSFLISHTLNRHSNHSIAKMTSQTL